MEQVITGNQAFERLIPPFHIWTKLKSIFKEERPLVYERHSKAKLALENLKANSIPVGKD